MPKKFQLFGREYLNDLPVDRRSQINCSRGTPQSLISATRDDRFPSSALLYSPYPLAISRATTTADASKLATLPYPNSARFIRLLPCTRTAASTKPVIKIFMLTTSYPTRNNDFLIKMTIISAPLFNHQTERNAFAIKNIYTSRYRTRKYKSFDNFFLSVLRNLIATQ